MVDEPMSRVYAHLRACHDHIRLRNRRNLIVSLISRIIISVIVLFQDLFERY
jgi:hypothetical protein